MAEVEITAQDVDLDGEVITFEPANADGNFFSVESGYNYEVTFKNNNLANSDSVSDSASGDVNDKKAIFIAYTTCIWGDLHDQIIDIPAETIIRVGDFVLGDRFDDLNYPNNAIHISYDLDESTDSASDSAGDVLNLEVAVTRKGRK